MLLLDQLLGYKFAIEQGNDATIFVKSKLIQKHFYSLNTK